MMAMGDFVGDMNDGNTLPSKSRRIEPGRKMRDTNSETTEEWYCTYCGSAQKKNTTYQKRTGSRRTSCKLCGAIIRFYVENMPTKTVVEAIEVFNKTPLTDSQAGHKPYKKRRKRKVKTKK